MNSLRDAFEDLVKDMYSAEKQVLEALPKAAQAADNRDLKAAFEEHRTQTQEHVSRLEQVARTCNFEPTGKSCQAAKGLIEEMDEMIAESPSGPVRDAMMICGAQKFEHYEIANYGTAVTWATALNENDCADLLQETLEEESDTDEKLTTIAESFVNQEALIGSDWAGKQNRASMR